MKNYTLAKEVIQRLILKSGNSMFSVTTDLWTSGQQNVGYICVTLHWINADFELIHLLIAFEEMPQPHSGVNLAVVLYRIFNSWNIEPHMMRLTVSQDDDDHFDDDDDGDDCDDCDDDVDNDDDNALTT